MSLEKALQALISLGLTQIDAQVYVFLAKKGTHGEKELADALKLTKQQLYRSLRKLQDKGVVNATRERPIQYSAVTLEEVLDLFIKAKMEQTKALQASRKELLSNWRSMIKKEPNNQ